MIASGEARAANIRIPVKIPLLAHPVPAEGMTEQTVGQGEPFLVRKLSALKSVSLTEQVSVDAFFQATLPVGTRLILAVGSGGTYYCGEYKPSAITMSYKVQWVCFRDADSDGRFDTYYSAPLNDGAFLPTFDHLTDPKPISAGYTADPEPWSYELAVVQKDSFNLYGRVFFYLKVRRQGEHSWSDLGSITRGVTGGYTTVPGNPLPQTVKLFGATFEMIAKTKDTVTVKPVTVESGVISLTVQSVRR